MAIRQGSSRKKGLDVASCLASLRNSRKTSVAGARRDLTATRRGQPSKAARDRVVDFGFDSESVGKLWRVLSQGLLRPGSVFNRIPLAGV